MASELASIAMTQELLGGVSRQMVYNLIETGRLQRVKLGGRAFLTRASVDQLVAELKMPA